MRKYSKVALFVLFLILVIEIVIIAPQTVNLSEEAQAPDAEDVAEVSDANNHVGQLMQGVHIIETSEGSKEWELWADEALSLKQEDKWNFDKVKAVFFGKNDVFFTVTGERGRVDPVTKDMNVEGNVVTRSSNGYVFRTEEVNYNSQKRHLTSPTSVEMVGPADEHGDSLKLTGVGLEADLEGSQMEVLEDVNARKAFKKGQLAHIRSRQAIFSGNDRMARFLGNVIIDFENMRISGPEAQFQYNKEKDVVESLYVKGGVRVSDTLKFATSDNVKVLFNEEKFIFRGAPRVVQNNDELRGEEIVFLNGGRRVKVIKARARVDETTMGQEN